jgi:hypothetical protein
MAAGVGAAKHDAENTVGISEQLIPVKTLLF